jgi:peptidoglycan/xylan/chitin deacetylase (PgdA/CDA1 family)
MKAALAVVAATLACASRPAAPILNYHSVGAEGRASAFDLTAAEFAGQLDWLSSAGYHTLTLAEVVERRNTARGVALTFDDGSDDALKVVLPALRKRGMRGTFFVITGLVGTPGYLSWDGVRELEKEGMTIGSHTVHHARLPDLPEERAREELVASRQELERHLGHSVDLLAYPYNAMRASTARLAASAGYRIAVAGPAHGSADPLRLYRVPVQRGMTLDGFQAALRQ